MAPEPAVLKRKRSRPSDWWAAAPTSNAPEPWHQAAPAQKKRGQPSTSDAERIIQEAPAAGNRGKTRKSIVQANTENAEGGERGGEIAKLLRRGRSSYMDAEAAAVAELAAEIDGANGKKRGHPAQREKEGGADRKPVRRNRPLETKADLQAAADPVVKDDGALKKKLRRLTAVQAEEDELVNEPVENAGEGGQKHVRPALTQEQDVRVDNPIEAAVIPNKHERPTATQAEGPGNGEVAAPALAPADGKKRRRHPRSTSKAEEPRPKPPIDDEVTVAKLLRRGRSSNTQDELQAVAAEVATKPQPERKKRGQRSKAEDELHAAFEPPPATRTNNESAKPLRRGRSSNTEAEVQVVIQSSTEKQISQKKRGKAANTDVEPAGDTAAPSRIMVNKMPTRQSGNDIVEPAISSTQIKAPFKRRKRQPAAEMDEPAAAESSAKSLDGLKAHGRRSSTVIEIEAATSSLARARDRNVPKKRGNTSQAANDKSRKGSSAAQKPSKSRRRQQPSSTDIQRSLAAQSRGKKSKHPSNVDAKRKHIEVEEVIEEPPEIKRRRVERESQQEPPAQTEKPPTYQHLAPVTRRVSRQIIEAKWEPLPPACVERISQLVYDLQRPVVVHLNDDRKRTEANTTLHMISRRLISKISKGLPFPPAMRNNREDDFDFEKILDHNRALEAQLTPALHANELLEAELAKEMEYFESDQAGLAKLEANAKSEATVRKDAGRRLHSLLHSDSMIQEADLRDHLGLRDVLQSVLPFSHTEDEDLQDIAQELNGHLDTIQGNTSRVEGISEAMTMSRAAVQATLFDHLESNGYEGIMLG